MNNQLTNEDKKTIRKTILPLKLVFWGGIFLLVDFNLNEFDLINDTLGWVLILVGIVSLTFISSEKKYEKGMTFVSLVTIFSLGINLLSFVNPEIYYEYSNYLLYFSGLQYLAIILFCYSMQWFSEKYMLSEIAAHWKNTTMLFVFFLMIPMSLNALIYNYFSQSMLSSPTLVVILIILIVLLGSIPIIHVFMAVRKMTKVAESY